MNPNIFREFSIRGIADRDLTDETLITIGQATALFFQQRNLQSVVVGQDVRNSSPRVSALVIQGLTDIGIKVINIGTVSTPVHNFATDHYQADGGVMVTASHNPAEYNGLKIRVKERTLYGNEFQEIFRLTSKANLALKKSVSNNSIEQVDPTGIYLERVKALANIRNAGSLKVVVDGGNGANGKLVSRLLADLNLDVVALFCEPDGDFPGRGPDPTTATALTDLALRVQTENADMGFAYDGDGDRLALVDDQGNQILGDQILMILARDVLQSGPAKIVYEILCTQALADDVIAHGGEPVMTPSGYAFVHDAMNRVGGSLGGELSGHLFFLEPEFRFDDSIVATLKLLNIFSRSNRPVSQMVAGLPAYYSSPQIRLHCADEIKGKVVEHIGYYFETNYEIDTIDGVRIHFDEGWATVRQSNTQPALSMRFEGRSADQLTNIQNRVQSLVEAEIARRTE